MQDRISIARFLLKPKIFPSSRRVQPDTLLRNMALYVAYYRVSTDKQDLGIPAQRKAVRDFVAKADGKICAEFEDQQSGAAKHRPRLDEALAKAREIRGKLVVAKLDRLSRSTYTIFKLRNRSGVDIVVADNPNLFADSLTLAVYAGLAEHERDLISQRTKAALSILKESGVRLGNPQGFCEAARARSLEKRRANSGRENATNDRMIQQLKMRSLTDRQVAEILNDMGVKTPKQGTIYKTYVSRRLKAIRSGNSLIQRDVRRLR